MGCTLPKDSTAKVGSDSNFEIIGFIIEDSIKCNGEQGELSVTTTGGNGNYNFDWSILSEPAYSTDSIITTSGDTLYTVIVTDILTSCTYDSSYTMPQPGLLEIVSKDSTSNRCYGGTDGVAKVEVTGGTQPYWYIWTNAPGDTVQQSAVDSVKNLATG